MPRFTLIESVPAVPEGLSSAFLLVDPSQTGRRRVLVVKVDGVYPSGSRGREHGRYVATVALHGLHAFEADCLILDLRGLTYSWGDTLLQVFQEVSELKDRELEPGEPSFPLVLVSSERCRDGLLSLLTPRGGEPPPWHFEEIDAAIEYGLARVDESLEFWGVPVRAR